MPQIVNIAIDQLFPHPDNPRKDLGGAAPARPAYRSKNEKRNAQFQQHDGSLSSLELEAIQKALRDGAPDA